MKQIIIIRAWLLLTLFCNFIVGNFVIARKSKMLPLFIRKSWQTWFSSFTFQTGGVMIGIYANKDTLFVLCPKSMSVHPPTPISIRCLRKQGFDTNPGPTIGASQPSVISPDFSGKPCRHTKRAHPSSLQSWQRHKPCRPESKNKLTLLKTGSDSSSLPATDNKTAGATWALGSRVYMDNRRALNWGQVDLRWMPRSPCQSHLS